MSILIEESHLQEKLIEANKILSPQFRLNRAEFIKSLEFTQGTSLIYPAGLCMDRDNTIVRNIKLIKTRR